MAEAYNATTVANRLIEMARAADEELTPMQIIKLTYIAHGWALALLGRPLIKDRVEAWRYGPVIPDLYRRLNVYGRNPVTAKLPTGIWGREEVLDIDAESVVSQVFDKYGKLSGIQLSHLTHRTGSPWFLCYKPDENQTIPDATIESHYKTLGPA